MTFWPVWEIATFLWNCRKSRNVLRLCRFGEDLDSFGIAVAIVNGVVGFFAHITSLEVVMRPQFWTVRLMGHWGIEQFVWARSPARAMKQVLSTRAFREVREDCERFNAERTVIPIVVSVRAGTLD